VRLVKGAYWDSEIKRAQERGLAGFPVFTRKMNTDVSYLACVRLLAQHLDAIYPQFATHNAQTVAYVTQVMARSAPDRFEFQRLHGMGEALYEQVMVDRDPGQRAPPGCRVYAPVGPHADLLPYLVRRLLENGANTSFVNRIVDETPAGAADRHGSGCRGGSNPAGGRAAHCAAIAAVRRRACQFAWRQFRRRE